MVEVHEGDELGSPVDYDRLCDKVLAIHCGFDFLRVDVLAVRAEYHALAASSDEDVAMRVDYAKVAGLEESVLGKCGFGSFFILEITDADILAFRLDFARNVLRVFGIDTDRSAIYRASARAGNVRIARFICQQWRRLCHSVSDGVRESDFLEPFLHVRIQRCSAHDDHLKVSTQRREKFLAYFLEDQ